MSTAATLALIVAVLAAGTGIGYVAGTRRDYQRQWTWRQDILRDIARFEGLALEVDRLRALIGETSHALNGLAPSLPPPYSRLLTGVRADMLHRLDIGDPRRLGGKPQ